MRFIFHVLICFGLPSVSLAKTFNVCIWEVNPSPLGEDFSFIFLGYVKLSKNGAYYLRL